MHEIRNRRVTTGTSLSAGIPNQEGSSIARQGNEVGFRREMEMMIIFNLRERMTKESSTGKEEEEEDRTRMALNTCHRLRLFAWRRPVGKGIMIRSLPDRRLAWIWIECRRICINLMNDIGIRFIRPHLRHLKAVQSSGRICEVGLGPSSSSRCSHIFCRTLPLPQPLCFFS